MDLRQLEAFAAVCETGSFSKAAARLFLTQPTVSAHIASLENEFGVKLVARTTKEAKPTRAGEAMYDYVKKMLELREAATAAMIEYSKSLKGTVSIAASSIPEQYFLPKLLGRFLEQHPDISFETCQADSEKVVAMVESGQVELGFCGTRQTGGKCQYQEFADDRLVVVTPNTREYAQYGKNGYPIKRIQSEIFISREKGSGTRRETESFFREMGVDPGQLRIAAELGSTESIKKMVSVGMGVAVISKSAAEDYVQFGKILAFDFDNIGLRRKLYVIRRRSGTLSPAAQAFFDFAKGFYK